MKHSRSTKGFSLTRPAYRDRDGNTQRSPRWHARFKDHAGIWRRLLADTDKSASMAFGRRLRDLAEWGVVERRSLAVLHGLEEHLHDWHDSIIDAGRTWTHADLMHARALKVVQGCGSRRYADIDAGAVERFVAKLRVSFVTSPARSGMHPKVAQTLARHSTMELTMRVSTKLGDGEQRAGVEALPPLPTVAGA